MEESEKLVSVIIPTFNSAPYLKAAIESVLKQTYGNLEILVIDDGSTDNTKEILADYIINKSIRYIYKKNGGPASARNEGIKNSAGEFIAFLDADDTWCDNEKIKKQVLFLQENPEHGVVGTNEILMLKDGKFLKSKKKLKDSEIKKLMLFRNEFTQSSVMMRKDVINKAGLFDEEGLYIAMEDYEYWARIGRSYKMANIEDCCVMYRAVGAGISSKNTFRRRLAHVKIIISNRCYYRGFLPALAKSLMILFVPNSIVLLKKKLVDYSQYMPHR
jgi:glycosyltransferase involved in cell wall biosynthesis